ncbi:MAG: hypothetical protein WC325_08665 [Candidatus Bathyarchaeia archaeon]|jgi:hypothetical protein
MTKHKYNKSSYKSHMIEQGQTQECPAKTETTAPKRDGKNGPHKCIKTRNYSSATSIHSRFSNLQSTGTVYYFRYDPQEKRL